MKKVAFVRGYSCALTFHLLKQPEVTCICSVIDCVELCPAMCANGVNVTAAAVIVWCRQQHSARSITT